MNRKEYHDYLNDMEEHFSKMLKKVQEEKRCFVRDYNVEKGMAMKRTAELFKDIQKNLGVGG